MTIGRADVWQAHLGAALPAHCTGWRAMHELANRLPEAFIPNSIGTRVELVAA